MLRSLILIIAIVILTGCSRQNLSPANGPATRPMVIKNVTAIDAIHGERPNVDILISGDQIVAIGSNLADRNPVSQAVHIDGSGKFLIPGLWDGHVHLTYDPGLDHRTFFPLALANGVTSLRDTGGHLDRLAEARAIAASDAPAPDLYVSGPLIDGAKRVYAGQSRGFPDLSLGAATPSDIIKIVDDLAAQDVDFLKAYEMLTPDSFQALVDRAKYHDLPVTAHSPLSMSAKQAVESGIKDMQHLRNLELDCVSDAGNLLEERRAMIEEDTADTGNKLRSAIHRKQRAVALAKISNAACEQLVQKMVKNGVSQTPTLTVTTLLTRRLYAEQRWRDTYKLVPADIAKGWNERSLALSDRKPSANNIAFDKWVMDMVLKLHQAGVPIIAGTDAPIAFLTPGASLHEELALLVDAGLPPMAALKAATVSPAEFFGLENVMGSIAPGMKADLVLLNANPLQDIRNSDTIDAVFKNGRLLDRNALDQLLAAPSELEKDND